MGLSERITESVMSRDSDIMVIRAMGNLDLDHRARGGISIDISLLDKHTARPQLPIYGSPVKDVGDSTGTASF